MQKWAYVTGDPKFWPQVNDTIEIELSSGDVWATCVSTNGAARVRPPNELSKDRDTYASKGDRGIVFSTQQDLSGGLQIDFHSED